MEIGDYVRTEKGIAKIIDKLDKMRISYPEAWVTDTYLGIYDDTEYIYEQDIIGEPKEKIIELIEVGDYVNGLKVIQMYSPEGKYTIWIKLSDNTFIDNSEDIKSIVTKEQFKNIEYEVK